MIALVLMLAAAIGGLPRVYTPDTSVEGYTKVPPPNIRMRMNEASATTVPWIDSNASRYMRGVKKAFYAKLPAGSAPLAAAEAFTYGVDAILEPAPEDTQALNSMLDSCAGWTLRACPCSRTSGSLTMAVPRWRRC